jgi:hypothetical protein
MKAAFTSSFILQKWRMSLEKLQILIQKRIELKPYLISVTRWFFDSWVPWQVNEPSENPNPMNMLKRWHFDTMMKIWMIDNINALYWQTFCNYKPKLLISKCFKVGKSNLYFSSKTWVCILLAENFIWCWYRKSLKNRNKISFTVNMGVDSTILQISCFGM